MLRRRSRGAARKITRIKMSRVYEEVDPKYAEICSDVTVCSKTNGFLAAMLDEVIEMAGSDWLKRLRAQPENQKLPFILENEQIMSTLTEVMSRVQPMYRLKCGKESMAKRKESMAAVQEGDNEKALAIANQAVIRAPMKDGENDFEGGVTLAKALWLRSDILVQLKRYAAALQDLKLALKERLPMNLRGEYYWQLGNCYKGTVKIHGIGEPSRAKVSYEIAMKLLEKDNDMKIILKVALENLEKKNWPPILPIRKPAIQLTGGAKTSMPALSKLVKITEEPKKGRFAVAESSIKTGDVLLIERPYAACLRPECYGTHCHNCFKRFADCVESAPIWCPTCSGVAFCSVQCRDAAVGSYHRYECKFMDMFKGSGMSVLSHIALRMITKAGIQTSMSLHEKYIENIESNLEDVDVEGVSKKNKKLSRKERLNRSKKGLIGFEEKILGKQFAELGLDGKSSYDDLEVKAAHIYSLCTHSEHRNGADYLKTFIMAMFLTNCLKKSGFFDTQKENDKTKAERAITELLVRNIQLLQFNAHEIYETLRGQHTVKRSRQLSIAVGIYPTGSLFNHDCYPSVVRYFDGCNIVMTAMRPIAPGDEVSENYGPHFMLRDRKARHRILASRYWFECQCTACQQDWPTLKQMKTGCIYFKCQNPFCRWKFSVATSGLPTKCEKCKSRLDSERIMGTIREMDKCLTQYEEGTCLMEDEKLEDAITVISGAIDLFHEIARPPHRETHILQEVFRSCIAMRGNVHRVKEPAENERKTI